MKDKIKLLSKWGRVYIRYSPGEIVEWTILVSDLKIQGVGDTFEEAFEQALKLAESLEDK